MKVDYSKAFPITSVTREDLENAGFDVSEISDETMQKLAQKLSDDYCNQLFWVSLEDNANYLKIPKVKVFDKDGNEIHEGDRIIWYDPDESHRDITTIYTVDKVTRELITIYYASKDAYSEADVFPNELKVVEQ